MIVLNLVKSVEKRPRESLLCREYARAVGYVNKQVLLPRAAKKRLHTCPACLLLWSCGWPSQWGCMAVHIGRCQRPELARVCVCVCVCVCACASACACVYTYSLQGISQEEELPIRAVL